MKVIKNYLYNISYQLFKIIIPIFTIPYISRVLGPQNVGINSYTYNIVQYFVLFGSIGINIYGNRKIAYDKDSKEKLSNTFWEIFFLQVITVSLSYGIFFIFLILDGNYENYYLAQSIMIIAAAFDISWFYMGIQEFKYTFYRNFIVKILVLIFIFTLVKNKNDLILYIILYTGSNFIGNISMFSYLRKKIYKPKLEKIHLFRHIGPSVALFVPQIAGQIYGIFNKNILGILDSVKAVGFFDQSDKVSSIIIAVVTSTGSVMLPYVANAYINGRREKTVEFLYDGFEIASFISVPISFGLASIASSFVPLFFSYKYLPVIPVLIIQSISCMIISFSNVVGIQYLIPTNQNSKFTISIFLGAITNILVDIPLIHFWGVSGSAFSVFFAELVVTSSQLILIRNDISYIKIVSVSYKYFISGIIMFIVCYYLNNIQPISWTHIIITIFVGCIVYLVTLFLLKAKIVHVISRIKNEY